jgi:DNA-binding Lrp family transcriptional regulator
MAKSHAPQVPIREMSVKPIFVQLQCEPGKTYDVADAIYKTELVSELYSTSGEYDLMLKIYLPQEEDIGKFIRTSSIFQASSAR